jgi:hypothetical protein
MPTPTASLVEGVLGGWSVYNSSFQKLLDKVDYEFDGFWNNW